MVAAWICGGGCMLITQLLTTQKQRLSSFILPQYGRKTSKTPKCNKADRTQICLVQILAIIRSVSQWTISDKDLCDTVPSGCNCIPVSARHGSSVYLAELCLPITQITASASRRGGLRSATTSNLVIPRCRLSTYGTRAFSVAGPVCWNSLPDYLKSSDLSFDCFRQQLKTFLFCKYWQQSQHYFSALETLLMRSTNSWYLLTYLLTDYVSLFFNFHWKSERSRLRRIHCT